MFISKFNRLFHKHGRLAFGLLTLFIIVPFVLYFSVAPDEIINAFKIGGGKSNIAINGKRVTVNEFDKELMGVMIAATMQGWPVDINSSSAVEQLTPAIINRMLVLEQVKKLDIHINDIQLADYMKTLPMLQGNNGFDYARYQSVLYSFARYGLSQSEVESSLREDASIDALRKIITSSVIVTDAGTQEFYNTTNQSYSVKTAIFEAKDYTSKVNIEDKALEDYFKAHSYEYMTPAKSRALIVRFDFSKFAPEAEKQITQDQIDKYFQMRKQSFTSVSEEKAKDEIKKQLIDQYSIAMAKVKAQEFAVNAYKAIETESSPASDASSLFSKLAEKDGIEVINPSAWISQDSDLISNIGKEATLVKQISALTQVQPISNAIEGRNSYFVALLTERAESKTASFDEVKNRVSDDYKKAEALTLARNAALSLKEATAKMTPEELAADKSFSDPIHFSQNNFVSIMSNPYAREIISSATSSLSPGQVSDAIDTNDGAILIYLSEITLPDQEFFKNNKANIENQYRKALEQIAWMNYNVMLSQGAKVEVYAPAGVNNP